MPVASRELPYEQLVEWKTWAWVTDSCVQHEAEYCSLFLGHFSSMVEMGYPLGGSHSTFHFEGSWPYHSYIQHISSSKGFTRWSEGNTASIYISAPLTGPWSPLGLRKHLRYLPLTWILEFRQKGVKCALRSEEPRKARPYWLHFSVWTRPKVRNQPWTMSVNCQNYKPESLKWTVGLPWRTGFLRWEEEPSLGEVFLLSVSSTWGCLPWVYTLRHIRILSWRLPRGRIKTLEISMS